MIENGRNRYAPLYGFAAALLLLVSMASCSLREQNKERSIEEWTIQHMGDVDFVAQARLLIDSMANHSPTQLEDFVRRIADVLCDEQKENLAVSIAAYPHGIDLSADQYSEIGHRLLTQLRLTGSSAPSLPLSEEDRQRAKGVIVLFLRSDCRGCHTIINELTVAYDSLQARGVAIVSIASDNANGPYEEYVQKLPWKNKYCDYTSFSGAYFKAWGVANIPTLYYITQSGIVSGHYDSLQEIKNINK